MNLYTSQAIEVPGFLGSQVFHVETAHVLLYTRLALDPVISGVIAPISRVF